MPRNRYADLAWTPQDVIAAYDRHITVEQAEEWLARNEGQIRDRLCELGYEVIDTLLRVDPPIRRRKSWRYKGR